MRSQSWLYALATFLLAATVLLSGCGTQPAAQAEPGQVGQILPTPPPMPTEPARVPTATPAEAPADSPQLAGTGPTLFQSDFASASSLPSWQVIDSYDALRVPSVWDIEAGRLAQVSDGEGSTANYQTALVTGEPTWTNYQVNVSAYNTGNDEIGVVFRANDQGYYVFRLRPGDGAGRQAISRYDAKAMEYTEIAQADAAGFDQNTWYRITVRVSGAQIQAYVNGQLTLEASDATLTEGRAGVYGFAQGDLLFDNFAVQAVQ